MKNQKAKRGETGKAPEERSAVAACFEWVEEIIIAVVVVVLMFSFIMRVVTVKGDSMLPNYQENDKLIISNMFYQPQAGDVVVLSDVLSEPIIKRIIAVEGQTVDIDNATGTVYVDGEALDESAYTENGITVALGTDKLQFPQTVPEDCVFVLGDNRVLSEDSRFSEVGMVSEDKILGEVKIRIYPFDRFGKTK